MLQRSIIAFSIFICLSLSGCLHRPDVQQGNIIPVQAIQQLKVGMSQEEAIKLLGTPVLTQTLTNQVTYVYTWQPGRKKMKEQVLVLNFSNGRLSHYHTNITP